MPQIANQDYLEAKDQNIDYRQRAFISGCIIRNTIFDLVYNYVGRNGGKVSARPLTIVHDETDRPFGIYRVYSISESGQIIYDSFDSTPEQYMALADMNDARMDTGNLLVDENGYVTDDSDKYLCHNGKYISVTVDSQNYIASYQVTDVDAGDGIVPVNIPEEDLPGLIGIFVGN